MVTHPWHESVSSNKSMRYPGKRLGSSPVRQRLNAMNPVKVTAVLGHDSMAAIGQSNRCHKDISESHPLTLGFQSVKYATCKKTAPYIEVPSGHVLNKMAKCCQIPLALCGSVSTVGHLKDVFDCVATWQGRDGMSSRAVFAASSET